MLIPAIFEYQQFCIGPYKLTAPLTRPSISADGTGGQSNCGCGYGGTPTSGGLGNAGAKPGTWGVGGECRKGVYFIDVKYIRVR